MARITPAQGGPPKTPNEEFGEKVKAHIRYKTQDGKQVPGVTTVLGVLAKPHLIAWANRLGLQGIDNRKYTDEAAQIGSLAHDIIMCELRGQTIVTDDFSKNQILRAGYALEAFHSWQQQHELETILIEHALVSERYRYGGTIDCLGLLDGVLTLIDYKTGKAIYDDFFIQVAAYWKLLEEHGHHIKGARILRIPRLPNEGRWAEENISGQRLIHEWEVFEHLNAIYQLRKKKT